MKLVIASVVLIAVLFLAASLFRGTYEPLRFQAATGQTVLPLSCAVVVREDERRSGTAVPGVIVGSPPSDIGLIRPIGEMLCSFLLAAAQDCFKEARLVTSPGAAKGSDVVLELVRWNFVRGSGTGDHFRGLPLLVASGSGYVALSTELRVTGARIASFSLKESARGGGSSGWRSSPCSGWAGR